MKRFFWVLVVLGSVLAAAGEARASSIYWSDFGVAGGKSGDIRRANANGTSRITLISGLGLPVGPTLDATDGQMYWGDEAADGSIRRANLDGTGRTTLLSGLYSNTAPALDLTHGQMYWADGAIGQPGQGDIRRANLDGSGQVTLVTGLTSPSRPALDLADGKIYWAESGIGEICRANLDGNDKEVLARNQLGPANLALDVAGEKIYWPDTGYGSTPPGDIRRSNLDGTGQEVLLRDANSPNDVTLDLAAGKMYWADTAGGDIRRANLDGTGPGFVIEALPAPATLTVDTTVPEPGAALLVAMICPFVILRRWRGSPRSTTLGGLKSRHHNIRRPRRAVDLTRFGRLAVYAVLALVPECVHAGVFSRMVVFGDSISDEGNHPSYLYYPAGYYLGRFSNGPTWVEDLAPLIGVPSPTNSLSGGANATNFAYGYAVAYGSTIVPNLAAQISSYLKGNTPAASDLFVIEIGGNDILVNNQTNLALPAGAIVSQIKRLAGVGAKSFLISTLEPIGSLPPFHGTSSEKRYNSLTDRFNQTLSDDIAGLRPTLGDVRVDIVDFHAAYAQAIASPQDFGFTNVTQGAFTVGASDPDHYLFWDDYHPTRVFHEVLAERAAEALGVPEPSQVALLAVGPLVLCRRRRRHLLAGLQK